MLCNPGGRLGLPQWRLLAWTAPVEVTGSGLLWKKLAGACSRGGPWLRPAPSADTPLYLLLQRTGWAWSRRGHWLRHAPSELAPLYWLLQRLLTQACSSRSRWLRSGSVESAGSDLLPGRLLSPTAVEVADSACSLCSSYLVSAPAKVADSDLVPQRSLSSTCSFGGRWLSQKEYFKSSFRGNVQISRD